VETALRWHAALRKALRHQRENADAVSTLFHGLCVPVTLIGGTSAPADEGAPPETTTIRVRLEDGINSGSDTVNCGDASLGLTKELLSAEGFADIRYVTVKQPGARPTGQSTNRGTGPPPVLRTPRRSHAVR
jgi:hypothetical protein